MMYYALPKLQRLTTLKTHYTLQFSESDMQEQQAGKRRPATLNHIKMLTIPSILHEMTQN